MQVSFVFYNGKESCMKVQIQNPKSGIESPESHVCANELYCFIWVVEQARHL
jgi:hypothetical protein